MQAYVDQLVAEVDAARPAKWMRQPPVDYRMSPHFPADQVAEGFGGPPAGYELQLSKAESDLAFWESLKESEQYVSAAPTLTMYDPLGFTAAQFPPPETLTDVQAARLADTLASCITPISA